MHPNPGLGTGRHGLDFSLGSSYLGSDLSLVLVTKVSLKCH